MQYLLLVLLILNLASLNSCESPIQTPVFDVSHYEKIVKDLCNEVYIFSEKPSFENCYLKDGCDTLPNGIEAPDTWKCAKNQTLRIQWQGNAKGVLQPVSRVSALEEMSGESDYQASKCMIKKIAYAQRLTEIYKTYGGVDRLRWIYMQTEYGSFVVFPEVSMLREIRGVGCSSTTQTCLTRELKRNFVLQALLTRKLNVFVVDMNKNIANLAYLHELIEARLDLATEYEYFVIIGHSTGARVIYPKNGIPVNMSSENVAAAKTELREIFYSGDRVKISDFTRATEAAFKVIHDFQGNNLCSDNIIYVSNGNGFSESGVEKALIEGSRNLKRRFRVFTFQMGPIIDPLFKQITCKYNGVSWEADNVQGEYHIKEFYASLMYDPTTNGTKPKWSSKTQDLLGLGDIYTVSMMCERRSGPKRGYGFPAIVATDIQVSQVPNPRSLEDAHRVTVKEYCPMISEKRNAYVLKQARSYHSGGDYCDGYVRVDPLPFIMIGTHVLTGIIGIIIGAALIEFGRRCIGKRDSTSQNKFYQIR